MHRSYPEKPVSQANADLEDAKACLRPWCCGYVIHCINGASVLVINLDTNDGRPLYLRIMDEIRRALVVGSLQPEDALPSVRELAAQLIINPRTVLQAYQELEREGVLYVRRGQGTFVSARARADRSELARTVAKRTLLEARRHGVDAEELIEAIRGVVADEERHPIQPAPAATRGAKK